MVAPGVHAGMVNLIGSMPDARQVLRIAGAKLHDYAKEARAGRKLGHVNVLAGSRGELMERIGQVRGLLR
jgi:5-(carboxyamino)imidazole ribonucleotide synthase